MKQKLKSWQIILALVGSITFLVSCGGGGGGGGITIPASYTGETTKAVINDTNAVAIVGNAWDLIRGGRDIFDSVPLDDVPNGVSAPLGLSGGSTSTALEGIKALRAIITVPIVLPGDCGGSADVSISVNDTTGEFTGQISFLDYCNADIVLNGDLSFTGKVSLATYDITFIKLVFDNLDMADGLNSYSITEGSVTYQFSSDLSSETDTIKLVLRDNTVQKTYWLNNVIVKIADLNTIEDEVTVEGRFYDHDYGYVDISTLTPLVVPDSPPIAGVLLFTGDGSKAKLTFNVDLSTVLEIDADNDGIFETAIDNPFPD